VFAIPNIGEAVWRGRAMVKKLLLPVAIVAGAGLAMAGTLSLPARSGLVSGSAAIRIVSGGIVASVATPPPIASTTSAPEPCTALTNSAGSTEPAPGTAKCGLPSHVTLQDRVWFGAYWQLLTTPIILGGGYVNARVERTSDGNFFDGIVDKVDADGRVTDVILAFAGAQGLDAVQGESILAGIPLDEAARATQVYERLLNDPRYANARIHVTGHSLGTGYTQYILAYALKTHGVAATDARSDFLAFGAPNWLASAAAHFGVGPELAATAERRGADRHQQLSARVHRATRARRRDRRHRRALADHLRRRARPARLAVGGRPDGGNQRTQRTVQDGRFDLPHLRTGGRYAADGRRQRQG
jgi:hypothetical protein